jgi:predicted small lipoprotein YifL
MALLVAGCGQKGPLVLASPAPASAASAASAVPR